jgi:hypothetical protein
MSLPCMSKRETRTHPARIVENVSQPSFARGFGESEAAMAGAAPWQAEGRRQGVAIVALRPRVP